LPNTPWIRAFCRVSSRDPVSSRCRARAVWCVVRVSPVDCTIRAGVEFCTTVGRSLGVTGQNAHGPRLRVKVANRGSLAWAARMSRS
jgi:hypothetical protein